MRENKINTQHAFAWHIILRGARVVCVVIVLVRECTRFLCGRVCVWLL